MEKYDKDTIIMRNWSHKVLFLPPKWRMLTKKKKKIQRETDYRYHVLVEMVLKSLSLLF